MTAAFQEQPEKWDKKIKKKKKKDLSDDIGEHLRQPDLII